MQPHSNNVDLFTIQIKKYMSDDFIIVDHRETLSNSIAKLQAEKKSSILVIKDNLLFGIIT